jgi:hypothetical protein
VRADALVVAALEVEGRHPELGRQCAEGLL